jgi:class 3 adenylate cyclase
LTPGKQGSGYDVGGGERRQLTVMFCDVVDSTGMSERRDYEDVRSMLQAFQNVAIEAIERFGGAISNYSGDGILAQFGYPVAIEKAPEAAVRAALAIVGKILALADDMERRYGERLQVRIGIQTGLVVIGDMGSNRYRQSGALVGEAPNVAARLQAGAAPGTIVIGGATEALLEGRFDLKPLGMQNLKGLTKGIPAYQVVGVRNLDDPFAASRHRASEMIGRAQELGELTGLWHQATAGTGQAVVVIGEAGMGKSRLVHELKGAVRSERFAEVNLYGSVHHKNVALYPLVEFVRRVSAGTDAVAAIANMRRLAAAIGPAVPGADVMRHLEELAFPSAQDGDQARRMAPVTPETRRKLRDLLLAMVFHTEPDVPLILVIEDAHWLDPSSLELVERMAATLAGRRALMIITSRTEIRIGAADAVPPTRRLVLKRLDDAACRRIVLSVADTHPVPESILRSIADRSDGSPLFAEELTLAYTETGLFTPARQKLVETGGPVDTQVPAALHDSLMVRLDRLGHAKHVAQLAAVLGRVFRKDLLVAMHSEDAGKLDAALSQLVESGIVERAQSEMPSGYRFKHALLRDAAYQSLLRGQRRTLHAQVGTTIETSFPEIGELEPDLVAQHWAQAHEHERAARYGLKAARLSAARSSNLEAMAQAAGVFEQASHMPGGPLREGFELEACIAMIGPVIATKGYGAADVAEIANRALELSRKQEATPGGIERIFPILYCQWSHKQVTGQVREAFELAKAMLAQAEAQPATGPRVIGRRLLGTSLLLIGQPASARVSLEDAVALYDPREHASLAYMYGTDFGIMSKCHLALALWNLGMLRRANSIGDEAQAEALAFGHANTLGYALTHLCLLRALNREIAGMATLAKQLMDFSTERELPFWGAVALGFLGWYEVNAGRAAEGRVKLGGGLKFMHQLNLVYWMPTYLTWVSEASAIVGDLDEAERSLGEAVAVSERGGERWFVSECWRIRARLEIERGRGVEAALPHLQRSLDEARLNGSSSFELRSAIDQFRLVDPLRPEPWHTSAAEALECALAPFAAEPEMADQREARDLLADRHPGQTGTRSERA